jgi:hypothetical protein
MLTPWLHSLKKHTLTSPSITSYSQNSLTHISWPNTNTLRKCWYSLLALDSYCLWFFLSSNLITVTSVICWWELSIEEWAGSSVKHNYDSITGITPEDTQWVLTRHNLAHVYWTLRQTQTVTLTNTSETRGYNSLCTPGQNHPAVNSDVSSMIPLTSTLKLGLW